MTKWHICIETMCQMDYYINGDKYDIIGKQKKIWCFTI